MQYLTAISAHNIVKPRYKTLTNYIRDYFYMHPLQMTYYKLLDNENKNLIVKAIGETEYEYVKGKGWFESGIMMRYFDDESPYYDL